MYDDFDQAATPFQMTLRGRIAKASGLLRVDMSITCQVVGSRSMSVSGDRILIISYSRSKHPDMVKNTVTWLIKSKHKISMQAIIRLKAVNE
jgi:hypothetical protein